MGQLRVFSDGRDPEVQGEVLPLPRRERRILEYLVNNKDCRVSKTQIFNYVYGLFSDDIDENVVESHISKLRKRLRHRLGYDPSIHSAISATASSSPDGVSRAAERGHSSFAQADRCSTGDLGQVARGVIQWAFTV